MDYVLLSPEQAALIYCHFACTYFLEILETLDRAKQQSCVLFPSIFSVPMENNL